MKEAVINQIIKKYGTPLFLYDYNKIAEQCKKLQWITSDKADVYYSMKANPTIGICQVINRFIKQVEVSSLGELYCALKAGFTTHNILFSGPGKRIGDLEVAVKQKIKISVESLEEMRLIYEICIRNETEANVLIRINPNFNHLSKSVIMTGISSQFGVDTDDFHKMMNMINRNYIILHGMNVYLGSQILEEETILKNCEDIINLAINLSTKYHFELKELDLGGGFGISYFDNSELNVSVLRKGLCDLFDRYRDKLKNTRLIFESGRYLTADSGRYITKVLYRKESKGKNYIVCDGGLNHILGSSYYNREIRDNYPIEVLHKEGRKEECYIAGPLCTPKDLFGRKVRIVQPDIGDYICVSKVGAYGLTFSPIRFISHLAPAEVMLKDDEFDLLRKREIYSDLFRNQILWKKL